MSYDESDRQNLSAVIIFRHFVQDNTEKIKIIVLSRGNILAPSGTPPIYNNMKIPFGEYVLEKI